ncbi:hypothetical protein ACXYTP_12725 [Tsukamurella ocularis]|uniref:hypothetical protein n=1 Tax=Tsukamurella ocularis TaxID=1970234 RepID=UPI0039EE1C89
MPVRGARSLAVFMGAMTVLWSVLGLRAAPVAGAVLAAAGAAVIVAAVVLARGRAAAATTGPDSPGRGRRQRAGGSSRSVFRIAVAAEIVAAVIAVVVLNRAGHPQYIAPAIALVVALHFFVFLLDGPQPVHLATGIVGTVGAVTAICLMAAGAVTPGVGHAIAGGALALCTLAYGLGFLRILADSPRSTTDPGAARD